MSKEQLNEETEETEGTEETETFNLPYEIILKRPVMIGKNTEMTKLVFSNHPDWKMVQDISFSNETLRNYTPVICGMTGRPKEHIEKLQSDTKEIVKVVTYFLVSSGLLG